MVFGEFEKCVECFEEMYKHAERFKVFSETKEITAEFISLADKDKFLYNSPYDYKKHLLLIFASFEKLNPDMFAYQLLQRKDFQEFVKKLNV
jgi:hypothetical protein